MLWILRVLPMARPTYIALIVAALLAIPACAQSSAQTPEHPAASSASVHRRTPRRTRRRVVYHRAVRHTIHHHALHQTAVRTTHRRVAPHTRRVVRSRHTVRRHHYTHRRRLARVHHYRRRHYVHRRREAKAPARQGTSPASALALTLASPALAHAAEPSVTRLASSATAAPGPSVAANIPHVPPETPFEAEAFHPGRIIPTAPLRGSFESLQRQNERTQADGLERILNNTDLDNRIARGFLVPVPVSGDLSINTRLPMDHRYCRPWTADFLTDLARAHETRFHHPLEVSSAVRTIDYQKRLERINGNAASAVGEVVSPHVTGATIDITKKGMSTREIYWMRIVLRDLQNQGAIDVEEEFHQACFHITVYKSYLSRNALRQARRHELSTEAAADGSF